MRSIMPLGDAVTVRPAVVADAPAVASVHVQTWQAAYRGLVPDSVLDGLSVEERTAMWERGIPRGGVWVGLVDDVVAGFVAVGPSREPDAAFEVYAIYVLPSAWGTGLGFSLARAALGDEQDVVLWVFDENPRARRFYERLGFRADGTVKTETIGGAELKEIRYRFTGVAG
ncbi:GNAT family N-acetyltransferase [Lentzea sp. BCCO 10_0061]|uniref:GNAT family N-acetyltransferase n=1 Tax=Lentzea sokolovensis TaxID=3095429 RepID=A0ABU4UVF4_9PSEU|nr:GNAT family N-acetyltransferase [Lentzea sp. BCCO 10_0061]MDX8143439.1 GNAT family N-acetyltransferase [Lentzea sp. BCCO 10_0061]